MDDDKWWFVRFEVAITMMLIQSILIAVLIDYIRNGLPWR